jgi:hypothetical protein
MGIFNRHQMCVEQEFKVATNQRTSVSEKRHNEREQRKTKNNNDGGVRSASSSSSSRVRCRRHSSFARQTG